MTAFLFPGQGSQMPGMGLDLYENDPTSRALFDQAAMLCEPGLLDTIFHGSADALKDTRIAQTALVITESVMARHLRSKGTIPSACAGHSVGEIAALVAAESIAFEEAVPLTQTRARLMTKDIPAGGMAAVIGLAPDAIEANLPAQVEVANYNGPNQTIISGTMAGLEQAEVTLKEAGAKRVIRLQVSGPFHSSFMRNASEALRDALQQIPVYPPAIRFISSVSGKEECDPEQIRELLWKQLCAPVRWTDVMHLLGPVPAIEVGPGTVLQGLARRTDNAPVFSSEQNGRTTGQC